MWKTTTLASEPTLPGDTPVARFDRVLSTLALLQTQLPHSYQSPTMLYDKFLDATRLEWIAHCILVHPANNPHALISHIQLLLTTGPPPSPRPMPPVTPFPTPPSTSTPNFLSDCAPVDAPRPGDAVTVDVEDDPAGDDQCWYVLKSFRANATTPYKNLADTLSSPVP